MHWYRVAQQLEFDFIQGYFFDDLEQFGFRGIGDYRYSLKVGNTTIKGYPDDLITKLNFIIESIRQDGIFITGLVQKVVDLDQNLRSREDMRLSTEEKTEYRDQLLHLIRGLQKTNISDKNKIAIRDKIKDIAETFLKNPTWIMMKLQTLNRSLNNFANKIWAQVNALSKKRDVLIEGIQKGYLPSYQSSKLKQKTQGYRIDEQDQDGIYKIIKPDNHEYLVDMNRRKCNCPAGIRGMPCKHLVLIDKYRENA